MFLSFTKFTNPHAALVLVRAMNLQLLDSPHDGLIQHDSVVLALAQGARLTVASNPLDTSLAEVVTTAAGEVWITEDGQAYGTVQFLRRALHQFKVVWITHSTEWGFRIKNLPSSVGHDGPTGPAKF